MPTKDRKAKEKRKEKRIAKLAKKLTPEKAADKLANTQYQATNRSMLSDIASNEIKQANTRCHQQSRQLQTKIDQAQKRTHNTSKRATKRACLSNQEKELIKENDRLRKETRKLIEKPEERKNRLEKHYGRKMRTRTHSSSIKEPVTPIEQTISGLYFERQESHLCGLHALNNLVQETLFNKDELNKIAYILDALENNLYDNPDRNADSQGNYNITVLKIALESQNYLVNEVTCDLHKLKNSKEKGMFLITVGHHHYATRKFVRDGPIFVLNSLMSMPYVDNAVWEKIELSIGSTNYVATNIYEVILFHEETYDECRDGQLNSTFADSKQIQNSSFLINHIYIPLSVCIDELRCIMQHAN